MSEFLPYQNDSIWFSYLDVHTESIIGWMEAFSLHSLVRFKEMALATTRDRSKIEECLRNAYNEALSVQKNKCLGLIHICDLLDGGYCLR